MNNTMTRCGCAVVLGILSLAAPGAYAADKSEHPGTTPGEMRYKGAPVPLQEGS